jgi:AcrR family transcriptional regulator
MTSSVEDSAEEMTWAARAAERAPAVRQARTRGVEQATNIVEAAQRLIAVNRTGFTMQQLLKEAGIALQTFYRYFEGKDQLLLAVIEYMVGQTCVDLKEQARHLPDPVARLRFYVTSVVTSLGATADNANGPRFITTEHWRLFPLYPDEVTRATKPFVDLMLREIDEATEAGSLQPRSATTDAWFMNQLVMTVYHHYAFATAEESMDAIAQRLWTFLLFALGGVV